MVTSPSQNVAMPAASPIPAQAGVGLRSQHFAACLADPSAPAWIEVHPENYMSAGGPAHRCLTEMRKRTSLSFHGVGLSLGGVARPDPAHLARLATLLDRYQPSIFSEHLAWSSHGGQFLNDLLPLPYTRETLDRLVDHVDEVQEKLGRQILIENPSVYLTFADHDFSEPAFLATLADRTGCGLLLDVNNVYVSANNLATSVADYLIDFPYRHVQEIHLAGHLAELDDIGVEVLIDSHSRPVADAVWQVYEDIIRRHGPFPTLIEWDQDLPDWPVLLREAAKAERILQGKVLHAVA